MMLVRTYLAPSRIHGIGVFAAERIVTGQPVWKFHPTIDQLLPLSALNDLSPPAREEALRHGYIAGEALCICADNARHINHSPQPNVQVSHESDYDYALHDIAQDDELTEDYLAFGRGACNEFLFEAAE